MDKDKLSRQKSFGIDGDTDDSRSSIWSRSRLSGILESISDGFFILNDNLVFTYFNHTAEKLVRRRKEDVLGRTYGEAFPEAADSVFAERFREAIRERKPISFETFFSEEPYRDWYDVRIYPYGEGISVFFQIITERKRAEHALAESERRFHLAMDATNEGLWDWNTVTNQCYFSPHYYTMLGYAPGDFQPIFQSWLDLLHPDDRVRAEKSLREYLGNLSSGRYRVEFRLRKKDDDWLWILGQGRVVELDEAGHPLRMVGTHTDITDLKAAQEQLREIAAFNQQVISGAREGIIVYDRKLRFILWNSYMEELTGVRAPDLIGELAYEKMPFLLESGMVDTLNEVVRGGLTETHRKFYFEIPQTGKSGWVSSTMSPFRNADGKTIGVIEIVSDVTAEQNQREQAKKLENQLFQAQKMDSIGRLAGGIAHDFNNLLTAIIGNAELALLESQSGAGPTDMILEIKKAAHRAESLTRQLLAFSRKQETEPVVLNLNDLLLDIDKMLRRVIHENIELVTMLGDLLFNIRIDRGQVQQVVTNLVVNARDAIGEKGRIIIETRNLCLTESESGDFLDLDPGEYVTLSVIDNGCGMSEEVLSHVFEPFFTTKEKHRGTGLGLATCYGIVKQNGGGIVISSVPEEGSRVSVYFPAVFEKAETIRREENRELIQGCETILLVEDDSMLRDMVQRTLQSCGYGVLIADNGRQAFELAVSYDGPIDLLITDVIMPQMGGRELAAKVAQSRPDIRVLYMSGYPEEHSGGGMLTDDKSSAFIQKPFTTSLLAEKIRNILHKA